MTDRLLIEPRDVLILRGNRLFGEAGSYGESLIPPWPSLAAGALRSALLVHDGVDPVAFGRGQADHPTIGSRDKPGRFAVLGFHLARRREGEIETLHPIPADLDVIDRRQSHSDEHRYELRRLKPQAPAARIASSAPLARLAVLRTDTQAKPASGPWLTQAGFVEYLAGNVPAPETLVATERLWKIDPRVGVALDGTYGRARDGALFTTETVAFDRHVGFLVTVGGAGGLPDSGTLRFGGDGRAASWRRVDHRIGAPDFEVIARDRRCRLVLTAPGIFPDGWLPPGVTVDNGEGRFDLHGVRGRLVCAAVPRAGVISGWDLAQRAPKPAHRTAPAGSVYWLDDMEATPEQLRKLAIRGLWPEQGYDAHRRAEGFNRFTFANY